MAKMWAGRTSGDTNSIADDFNSSIRFDSRMYAQDITGSMAHAAMLGKMGIITETDADTLIDGLQGILDDLNAGKLARTFDGTEDDMAIIGTSDLLTLKKTIYVANLAENEINEPENNRHYMAVKALAAEEGSQLIPICAKLEADIAELDDPEEKAMFMEELGVNESGLDKLIRSSYALLGLISFLTAGSDECRAWTIRKGTKAPQAAGKIHTDFERGFIRAEVIAFEDMKDCGTMANAKTKGLVRSEGKEYVMKDGDIVNFLFNV